MVVHFGSVTAELVSDSLVYRYDPQVSPDGLRGEEGTFSICSFWYVEALTRAGRLDEARLALAFWCVLVVLVWSNVGFYVVLFSAGMQSIPRDIYEAVLLDGASRLTTVLRITVPLLWDTIQVSWVYLAILALDGFAVVQIITNGGPGFSSDVIGLRLYNTGFGDYQFGYASAIGVAMLFLTLSVAVLALRLTRRERVEFQGGEARWRPPGLVRRPLLRPSGSLAVVRATDGCTGTWASPPRSRTCSCWVGHCSPRFRWPGLC